MKKLMLLGAFLMCSCKTMTPYQKQLVDCSIKAVQDQLPTLVPQVLAGLNGQAPNWNADLTVLISATGEAGVCALEASIVELESQMTAATVQGVKGSTTIPLARAYYLRDHLGYTTK